MRDRELAEHERWDELAAGHALHALEPSETAEFEAHRDQCARCRQSSVEMSSVAAQLGSLAAGGGDEQAPPWRRMRPAIVGTASPGTPARSRRRWLVPAAAIAPALAGVVVLVVVSTSGSSESRPLTVAACVHDASCHQVVLHTTAGGYGVNVLVRGRTARIVTVALGTLPAGSEWVLWQVPRGGRPVFVQSFGDAPGPAQSLATSYAGTESFAVSREPSGSRPAQPSEVVASGPVG